MSDISTDVAKSLLKIGAVRFSPDEPFTYTSGMKSPIYCDIRLLMSFPEERNKVIPALIAKVAEEAHWHEIDLVSGTATAGIPMSSWVADRMNKPMVYVRSSAKKHGLGNQIEGTFQKGDKVLIVEDIVSSGKSSMGNIEAVREAGAEVVCCIAVACYEMPMALDAFKSAKVPLLYLTPMQTVADVAVSEGVLTKEQKEIVLDWLDDPKGWAERNF